MSDLDLRQPERAPLSLALLLPALALACGGEPAEPPGPPRVESAAFGIAFSPMPESFTVETNDDSTLSFRPATDEEAAASDGATAGRVWVALGPAGEPSINLVDLVNEQKQAFEALPNGEFFGSRELITPSGPAYYSRGRYDLEGGERVEEIRLFQIHPGEYRLLTLHYRYPAAEDSAQRLQGLLELAGALEAFPADSTESEQAPEGSPDPASE
jgi:hypothetical protein